MAAWPYSTAAWQRLRAAKLSADPLCEPCQWRGVQRPATAVDHIVSIASGGHPFPPLTGLRSMCVPCHSVKTAALDRKGGKGVAFKGCGPDGLPLDAEHPFRDLADHRVTLVCGPPGSGKSTYVQSQRRTGDLVLDLDVVMSALCGEDLYQAPIELLPFALHARDAVLDRLRRQHDLRHAWIITGGATVEERNRMIWALDASTIVLAVPADVCISRINADLRRPPTERAKQIAAVQDWWRRYQPHTPLEGPERFRKGPARDLHKQLVRDWSV